MRSPVPVNTSKRGEVADGIGGTRGMAGGARPPPPITTAWGRVPPLPSSPLLCVIISLFLSPFSLSEDFIGHPHTPLGIAWRRHLALRRFTFLVPGLDRTQTPDCSVRRGEAQAGLGPSAVDSSRPRQSPGGEPAKGQRCSVWLQQKSLEGALSCAQVRAGSGNGAVLPAQGFTLLQSQRAGAERPGRLFSRCSRERPPAPLPAAPSTARRGGGGRDSESYWSRRGKKQQVPNVRVRGSGSCPGRRLSMFPGALDGDPSGLEGPGASSVGSAGNAESAVKMSRARQGGPWGEGRLLRRGRR